MKFKSNDSKCPETKQNISTNDLLGVNPGLHILPVVSIEYPPEIAREGVSDIKRFQLIFTARHANHESWAKIGKDYKIHAPTVRLIANGYEPGNKVRKKLGLPPMLLVKAMECSCGEYFISNHPRRIHCFICRPFRTRRKL